MVSEDFEQNTQPNTKSMLEMSKTSLQSGRSDLGDFLFLYFVTTAEIQSYEKWSKVDSNVGPRHESESVSNSAYFEPNADFI